jgi:predicted metal-binding membrane protein
MTRRSATRLIDDPRTVTVATAVLVSAGLWLALWKGMGGMAAIPEMAAGTAMPGMPAPDWSAATVGSTVAMWLMMMAAMMLPAMAPMLAVYVGLAAREDRGAALATRVALFALGYFLLWALFSLAAAIGQLALRDSAHFTMGGTLATPAATGALLLVAGAWQFTPVKDLCVRHCRHPLHYLMVHWREGTRGAFAVGARHGLYCFGCCIAFMGLMFVFGAMNVLWMAAIATYFLAEKVLPRERLWGRAAGALLLVAGAAVLIREVI